MKKEQTAKKTKFGRGLLIYAAVLLVLFAAALVVFWNFLASYDASLPETALNDYLSSMTQADWKEMIMSRDVYHTNAFELADALYDKTASAIADAEISYVKNYETYTDAAPTYFLMRDGKKFAELSLKTGEDVGFGFTAFAVDGCHVLDEVISLEPFSVMVLAPKEASVTLNGKTLDESYITETDRESHELSKYSLGAEDRPKCTVYTVDGFYELPTAEATLGDAALTVEANGALFTFAHPADTFETLTIIAPSTALVRLNGIKLDDAPTSEVVLGENPYEEALSERITMNTYALTGLFGETNVECYINGKPLACTEGEGVLSYAYPEENIYRATLMAPAGAEITVNGIAVLSENEKTTAVYDGFDTRTLANWLTGYPMCDMYDIGTFYLMPEIKATLDGVELSVTTSGTPNAHTVVVGYPTESEVPADIAKGADEFARAFLYYTTRGYYEFTENMTYAMRFTVPQSDAYYDIYESRYGVYFNSCYDITYNKIESSSVTYYTDECVGVTLDFDIGKTRYGTTTQATGRYLLTLIKRNDAWTVAEFTMVAMP